MTPAEMLAVLDDAIAVAKRDRERRSNALELRGAPQVFGVAGKPTAEDGVYSFTARQCKRIRKHIYRELRAFYRDDLAPDKALR